jgi:hypothetical protein
MRHSKLLVFKPFEATTVRPSMGKTVVHLRKRKFGLFCATFLLGVYACYTAHVDEL